MTSNWRIASIVTIVISLCMAGPITSAQASDASSALVAEGRALIFQGQVTTYADIVAARDKFEQAVSSDPTDKTAHLFCAVTRMAAFFIDTSPAGLDTAADLASLFGLNVHPTRPLGQEPFDEPPLSYDQYDPPATVPDGATFHAFLQGPFITEIDGALANLEAVGSGFALTLSAAETGDQQVEIDAGDILLFKSTLQLLKASLLIVTAYDLDIDLRELMVLGNAGVLRLQELLDENPDLLKLRSADGIESLTEARASLMAGIDNARAAYDAISLEGDLQDDDLFYFDSDQTRRDALGDLIQLEEINSALAENRAADFSQTYESWTLTNIADGSRLAVSFEYITTPPAGTLDELILADTNFYGIDSCNFFTCGGYLESIQRSGNQVTWNLTTGGSEPFTATINGTVNGDTIAGNYTRTTNSGTEGPYNFAGIRNAMETGTKSLNPNAVFGNTGQNPLDIRAALPKFGIQDDAVAGTFPANTNGHVLNGIWPGAATNKALAAQWELRHETHLDGSGGPFFNIPTVSDGAIVLDGNQSGWPAASLVFTDFSGDENEGADLAGGDIQAVYAAKDSNYFYVGIQLADGNPLAETGMAYVWEAMNDYENGNQAGNPACYAYRADGQWVAGFGTKTADPWAEPNVLWTGANGDVAAGTGFIEWRAPLAEIGDLFSGRWLRVYSHQTSGHILSDDNPTQIRIETATLSGTVSCADCTGDGKFFVAALPCAEPAYRCGDAIGDAVFLENSGSYTLTGIPIGATVYLHVIYDANDNGILDFGDTTGVSGPVAISAGENLIDSEADTPINDDYVMTKAGVYRVFGSDTNPLAQPFYGPWNPNDIDWSGAEMVFLGESSETATIPASKFYKYILILWHGDRIFSFDAIQDLTAGTAFRVNQNGNPAAGGWITAGLSNPGDDGSQEPTNFIGPPDGQVAISSDWPGFMLLEMPDDTVDESQPRQLQLTVEPPFSHDSRVMNTHDAQGVRALFITDIYDYSGSLPQDIDEWAVTGPGIDLSYTGAQIAAGVDGVQFDPAWNEVYAITPGSPQVGTYTFRLTIAGQTRTYTGIHHINRDLPLPDATGFAVQPDTVLSSKTPMFSWAAITDPASSGIAGARIAYRLQIRDRTTGEQVVSTPRTYSMTHFTVPAGKLSAGTNYEYRVRATDSSDWLDVQNRSQSAWIPFSMAASLDHASTPQFLEDWNALTYTTPNGTFLAGSVTVYDADGIAADGSSHQVSVSLPDGSSVDLNFDSSSDNQTAYYWGSGPVPESPDGIYTFTVTDLENRSATTTDTLIANPLAPVDPAQLRPSLYNPVQEYIHAVFDDVKVNGVLYDAFDLGALPDTDRWNYWDNGGIQIDQGALHLSTLNSVGRADTSISLKNPESVDAVEAAVTVSEASSETGPQARISGYWFNQDGLDVWATISVTPMRVAYSISTDLVDETMHWQDIANGTLKTVEAGETVTVGISWNGTSMVFKADEATYTYTPTGTVLAARYPEKQLQVRINLVTSVTPTFRWNPIEGAEKYRVRIYNNDSSRTLHRGPVDGQTTTYTVPPGVLRPNAYYRYRVEAWDSAGSDPDNISKVPASNSDNYRFYTGTPGDMNSDGAVDLSDAILALRVLAGDTAVHAALAGDVDANRRIGAAEAMSALQEVAGWR